MCPLCNAAMEDVQHVFFRCDVARAVLRKISPQPEHLSWSTATSVHRHSTTAGAPQLLSTGTARDQKVCPVIRSLKIMDKNGLCR
ncbi:hypothetical protein Tco_1207282 [Tanacetum coccineum]